MLYLLKDVMERSIMERSFFVYGERNCMAATVKQIAKELNISFQLVSAVLSGKNYCRASKEKKKLILETAAEMGYMPNVNARVLAGKPSGVLGLLADLHAPSPSTRVLAELEKAASLAGFRLMIGGFHDSVDDIISSYRLLQQHKVDGVFLLSLDDLRYRKRLTDFLRQEKHLVVIRAPLMKGHFCVEVDLSSVFEEIVRNLKNAGRKNIHYLGTYPASHQAMKERICGFSKNFGDAETRLHRLTFSGGVRKVDGMLPNEFIKTVIKRKKVDSLVIQDDLFALEWLNLLHEHHLKIPEDIAVTGCNNETFAHYTLPSLSSVDFNETVIARAAMDLMQKSLNGAPPETIRLCPEFIPRNSFQ